MKKNDLVKFVGIGLVVAIIATGVFYGLIVNKLSSSTGSGKSLVVAAHALKGRGRAVSVGSPRPASCEQGASSRWARACYKPRR